MKVKDLFVLWLEKYAKLGVKTRTYNKYEVIVRILKEIRQLKAIEDEQMQFEVVITVEEPKQTNG